MPRLYIFWFLHQTTTLYSFVFICILLYIFWFLHQTTTYVTSLITWKSCISFDSYIKPQPIPGWTILTSVVYLLIPTSNHNQLRQGELALQLYIFWFLHQTTTCLWYSYFSMCCISFDSYIKPQLSWGYSDPHKGCISFDSYINPQPDQQIIFLRQVVYLLIPTSNHNRL